MKTKNTLKQRQNKATCIIETSGSQTMGHDPKLGHGEHSGELRIHYPNHFIFNFNKRTLIKQINVKTCGKETNIQISLHINSLSCNYFQWHSSVRCLFSV
jgi:hypothetical protein